MRRPEQTCSRPSSRFENRSAQVAVSAWWAVARERVHEPDAAAVSPPRFYSS